jgi:hypothetical protein
MNLLPQIGIHMTVDDDGRTKTHREELSIMDLAAGTDEIDVFLTSTIQEIIEFKWRKFGMKFHIIGSSFHMFYVSILLIYTNLVYVAGNGKPLDTELHHHDDNEGNNSYAILLMIGTVYPALYDFSQIFRVGMKEYLLDPWNYTDMLYIWSSIAQVILHSILSPYHLVCKLTMFIVVFLGMVKTFFYLRIFDALSPIVTMIARVVRDLGVFMLFFSILILMFSILLDILGLSNRNIEGKFQDEFAGVESGYPGEEFAQIGLFWGNILLVFRAAMGDFTMINSSIYLTDDENVVFWWTFFVILAVTNIIFLNFVIAEAGNSYSIVNDQLTQFVLREKANLIDEAESMIPQCLRKDTWYPKYIIVRTVEM